MIQNRSWIGGIALAMSVLSCTPMNDSTYQSWYQSVKEAIRHMQENASQRRQYLSFDHVISQIINKPASWYPEAKVLLMEPLQFTSLETLFTQHQRYRHYKKKYVRTLERYYEDLDLTASEAVLTSANRAMIRGLKECNELYAGLFAPTFESMMAQERLIHTKGNKVLYHGTSRFNYALSYLHTKLHDLFHEPSPGYLHLRQPIQDKSSPKKINDYLKHGGSWLNFNDTQHLLFCNCALTANLKQHLLFKEDSITFFTQGNPVFSVWREFLAKARRFLFGKKTKISVRKLFRHYGLEDFYFQNKGEILTLLSFQAPGNIMLQIELSPALAQKAVYPAEPIGKRCPLIVNGKKTTDILTILDTLSARPSAVQGINGTVWCLILTQDLLLNPHHPDVYGNIHFYRYAMNEEQLRTIENQIDALVKKIAPNNDNKEL